MKIKTILIIAVYFLSIHFVKAQTLTPCTIYYFYDAAGNRIARIYTSCATSPINGGGNSTKSVAAAKDSTDISDSVLANFQIVMIAPNPTGGPFSITCNEDLNNASVKIIDLNGQVVAQSVANGRSIPMNISNLTVGTYTVVVTSNGTATSKSLVKIEGH